MTPNLMAQLHLKCFETPRPWREDEFAAFLKTKGAFICSLEDHAFILGRVVAGEAELVTIAVDPKQQGRGYGFELVNKFEEAACRLGADNGFLEVSVRNLTAQRLYEKAGWCEVGKRRGYYSAPNGDRIDAIIMAKSYCLPDNCK